MDFFKNFINTIKSKIINLKEILKISYKRFFKNKEIIRADVLTFYTLLAIVPFIAIIFGIAKGFGFNKAIEKELVNNFPLEKDILYQIFVFVDNILEKTQGGLVAGTGLIILIWTISKVLNNMEEGFNEIWETESSRSVIRKTIDYIAIVFLTPLAMSISSSVNIFVISELKGIAEKMSIGTATIYTIGKITPFLLIIIVLSIMYIIIPNKRIKLKSGILGGIIAGILFIIIQRIYINLQIGVVRYNAIYGSFSFVPLFLLWVRTSWVVILIGAEIAYAAENLKKYKFKISYQNISLLLRKKIAIDIMYAITRRFETDKPKYSSEEIAEQIQIPVRIVENIIKELLKIELIYKININEEINTRYAPAVDPSMLTVDFVIKKMESYGENTILNERSYDSREISDYLDKNRNKLVKEIEIL